MTEVLEAPTLFPAPLGEGAGFARVHSVGLLGLQGHVVEVEAHVTAGLPGCRITGLADTAVAEARDRVRAALLNSGEKWPDQRITIGLGPAWLRKHGSAHDLAVAVAILAARGRVGASAVGGCVFLGELGLSGRLRPIPGMLPAILAAAQAGFSRVYLPAEQAGEASVIEGLQIVPVASFADAVAALHGAAPSPIPEVASGAVSPEAPPCMRDVVGQPEARAALEASAAGGHHIALIGPPGAGKTMLAERLPGILPRLDPQESLEVTALHSIAGPRDSAGLITVPPFQAPHHTSTLPSLVGGGSPIARPGALSLAHRGVLFLDEATEFPTRVLDALRQPLEHGEITLARAGGITSYPARVQLVLAANPCPCGASDERECVCSQATRRRYLGRLSGPLMDRIDIQIDVAPVNPAALFDAASEPSALIAQRVLAARAAARARWGEARWSLNAQVPGALLRGRFRLPGATTEPLDRAVAVGELSARGYDRVLRLAWSLADLAGVASPTRAHVQRALALRVRRPQ